MKVHRTWACLLCAAMAGCGGTESAAPAPVPPAAESSRIYWQDNLGTWFLTLADPTGTPVSFSTDPRPGSIVPSPLLDKVALVCDGQAVTEIYDVAGNRLATVPSDHFAGWASNESVVAGLAKWDMKGSQLLSYPIPSPLGGATISNPAFIPGRQLLSPDGKILVAEPTYTYSVGTSPDLTVFFFSTSDGRLLAQKDLGMGDVSFWTASGEFVFAGPAHDFVRIGPDLGTSSDGPVPFQPCAGQAWATKRTMLLWQKHTVVESDYTYDECALPFLVAEDGSSSAPASFLGDFSSLPGSPLPPPVPVALAPDRRFVAFGSGAGLEVCDPQGAGCQSFPTPAVITAVAWDSPNSQAPEHDTTVAPAPSAPLPGLNGGSPVRPGAPGTPPSSDDCTLGRWYERTPQVLPANWPLLHSNFAAAYDRSRGFVLIDGGRVRDAQDVNWVDVDADASTWEWNGVLGTWTNRSVTEPPRPPVSAYHRLVFDNRRNVMVAIVPTVDAGGNAVDEVWTWVSSTGTWGNAGCATGSFREPLSAVYDDERDAVWALDRFGVGGRLARATCAWTRFTAPDTTSVRLGVRLAYDTRRGVIYQFGSGDYGGKVLAWDGSVWTILPAPSNGPGGRESVALAFDEDRGRLMVFSGMTRPSSTFDTAVPADLWEWNPDTNAWTLCGLGPTQPQARIHSHMLFDANRHALLLMAGTGYDDYATSTGELHDLWEWAIP